MKVANYPKFKFCYFYIPQPVHTTHQSLYTRVALFQIIHRFMNACTIFFKNSKFDQFFRIFRLIWTVVRLFCYFIFLPSRIDNHYHWQHPCTVYFVIKITYTIFSEMSVYINRTVPTGVWIAGISVIWRRRLTVMMIIDYGKTASSAYTLWGLWWRWRWNWRFRHSWGTVSVWHV